MVMVFPSIVKNHVPHTEKHRESAHRDKPSVLLPFRRHREFPPVGVIVYVLLLANAAPTFCSRFRLDPILTFTRLFGVSERNLPVEDKHSLMCGSFLAVCCERFDVNRKRNHNEMPVNYVTFPPLLIHSTKHSSYKLRYEPALNC